MSASQLDCYYLFIIIIIIIIIMQAQLTPFR